jgi:hypothetical protein
MTLRFVESHARHETRSPNTVHFDAKLFVLAAILVARVERSVTRERLCRAAGPTRVPLRSTRATKLRFVESHAKRETRSPDGAQRNRGAAMQPSTPFPDYAIARQRRA